MEKKNTQPEWNGNLVREILKNHGAERIKSLIDIQKRKGTYDYNEHMFGVLIGLECAYHTLLEEHEYTHTEPPTEWLEDKIPKDYVPEVANVQKVNMYGEVYPQYPFDTSS